MVTEKTKRGGPRQGAGRRHLDGSPPGQGEYLARKTITLPESLVEYARKLSPKDQLSDGIRIALLNHQKTELQD